MAHLCRQGASVVAEGYHIMHRGCGASRHIADLLSFCCLLDGCHAPAGRRQFCVGLWLGYCSRCLHVHRCTAGILQQPCQPQMAQREPGSISRCDDVSGSLGQVDVQQDGSAFTSFDETPLSMTPRHNSGACLTAGLLTRLSGLSTQRTCFRWLLHWSWAVPCAC